MCSRFATVFAAACSCTSALHARLERRYEDREGGDVKEELKKANFKTELIKAKRAEASQAGLEAVLEGRRNRLDQLPP